MTDIKKTIKDKGPAKKLQLNKETIKDLTVAKGKIENIVGGARCCSKAASGCIS